MNKPAKNTNNQVATTGTDDRGLHKPGDLSAYSSTERDQLRALAGLDEASDGDLDMLAKVCQRTGLDPFIREIYLIGRKTKTGGYRGEPERWETKWSVQTGIDGFRKVLFRVAEKESKKHSISAPVFYDANGNTHEIWLKAWGNPAAARVEVTLGDSVGIGLATWDEYAQTKNNGEVTSMWKQLGPTMLAKCAEAQAHRRVNSLTSGIYAPEEMEQAENRVRMDARRVGSSSRGASGVRAALAGSSASSEQSEPVADTSGTGDNSQDAASEAVNGAIAEIAAIDNRDDLEPVLSAFKEFLNEHEYSQVAAYARKKWSELNANDS